MQKHTLSKAMSLIQHDQLASLVPEILRIAAEAGEKILEVYNTDFTVKSKEDNSPLTAADMAAHKHICNRLKALTPATPILSEESASIPYEERQSWQQYWLVDPLDGTREFIKRNGEFTVNIALIEDDRSILGVIYIPVTAEGYSASLGSGASKHDSEGNTVSIQVAKTADETITVAGSRSHGNERLKEFIASLNDPEVLSIGSSMKFCLIAEGKADIYPRFGPTSEWDTAAAQCIVEEAGGMVVDTAFNRLRYNTKESLLNPAFLVIADPDFDWQQYL